MANYVSNTPISRPIRLHGVNPEVDLNGIQFSYLWGLCYDVPSQEAELRPPEPI